MSIIQEVSKEQTKQAYQEKAEKEQLICAANKVSCLWDEESKRVVISSGIGYEISLPSPTSGRTYDRVFCANTRGLPMTVQTPRGTLEVSVFIRAPRTSSGAVGVPPIESEKAKALGLRQSE